MKLQTEFKNFIPSLMFFIEDKNPVMGSNDNKLIAYFLGLKNFKKGFDYYELVRHSNGGAYFRIVTMLGFKIIVETNSEIYYKDLSEIEWQKKIFEITMIHFRKEEYISLSQGYVKKGNSGCFGSVLLTLVLLTIFSYNFFF